jgi:DNA-binding response OmpR family regulator
MPRSPRPADGSIKPTVLIVDDDQGTRETFAAGLRTAGFVTATAADASEALGLARLSSYGLAVFDLRLPDMSGTDLVRTLEAEGLRCPFILISGFLTTQDTVDAMRLGAKDVLDKPVDLDDLCAAVDRALESASSAWPAVVPAMDVPVAEGAERWARLVLRGSQAARDLKTLEEWARFVGVSYTSLCELCRMLGIRAHDARDLARMLRAFILARRQHCAISVFLDIHDERTLRHLLDRAGLDSLAASGRSLDDFLTTQRIVDAQHPAVHVLRALLSQGKR